MIWFAVFASLFFSLMAVGLGYLFIKRPPRKINMWYGYRTARSMKSQAAWDFAHAYAGHVWIRCGFYNAVVSAILILIFRNSDQFEIFDLWLTFVQLVIIFSVVPITERALGRQFDKDGNPRT